MRASHTPHSLPTFPVYSSAFLSHNELVLGGGGGASRSGIKNKLRLYAIGNERSLELVNELELEAGEDAPMSMAGSEGSVFVCGINSAEEYMQKGINENCRTFNIKDKKLVPVSTRGTLPTGDMEDYQKVTVVSLDGSRVAAAGGHDLSLLSYPTLEPIAQRIHTEKEIYDATFSEENLVIATTNNLLVYALPANLLNAEKSQPSLDHLPELELVQTVNLPPSTGGDGGGTFRAARFHPTNSKIMYTVVNASPPRSRNTKGASRPAFICRWDTTSWTVEKTRKVSDRALTCFDISPDGKLLGFGSSDLTVGLLDGSTLAPFVTILKAHEFPPTTLKFNPTSTLLVSGSADNSVRLITVPEHFGGTSWGFIILFIMAILVILLGFLIEKYLRTGTIG